MLLERLLATPGARIVTMSSTAHKFGRMQFADLQFSRGYRAWAAYGQSKLANLLFTYELQRRLARAGQATLVVAAHPGWASTDIIGNGMGAGAPGFKARLIATVFGMVAQSARDGALPSLYAAMAPEAQGGFYYGPTGWNETRGAVGVSRIFPQAADPEAGTKLWTLTEKLTGVTFGSVADSGL